MLSRAIVVGKNHRATPPVKIGRKAKSLVVLHGTNMQDLYFVPSYYMPHRDSAEVLRYRVKYSDGKTVDFSARYGDDIGWMIGTWPMGGASLCHRAVPVPLGKGHTFYAQEWVNPRPNATIASVQVLVGEDAVEKGEAYVAAVNLVASGR
jgi:hypothetical protein